MNFYPYLFTWADRDISLHVGVALRVDIFSLHAYLNHLATQDLNKVDAEPL